MEALTFIVFVLLIVVLYQNYSLRRALDVLASELRRISDMVRRQQPDTTAPAAKPIEPLPVVAKNTLQPRAPVIVPAQPASPVTPKATPLPSAAFAPRPAPPPPPDSPLVQSAKAILRKIWDWILVGEDHRPAGVATEYAVATTWLMRAGIIAIVACVGFFLKWSIERELVGPIGRVSISVFFGLTMLIGGLRLLGKRWNVLGQGFAGGGLAVLYFALYAAGPLYHLLPTTMVFILMVVVTFASGVIAVSVNSLLIAVLGIVGGFVTPVMLNTGVPRLPALAAYLLLLNIGILGIAHFRQWRLLNYLAFVGSWCLVSADINAYYDKARDFPLLISLISALFLIHSLLVFIYNIRKALHSTMLEVAHMLLNAAIYGLVAYHIIHDAAGRPYPAIMTVSLAVWFILLATIFLQKKLVDRPLLMAMIGLGAFFAVISVPLIVEKETLTICWSLLALLLLWLSARMTSNFLRHLAYLMFALVFIRLATIDFPRDFGHAAATATFADYLHQMLGRLWTFGTAVAALLCAFLIEQKSLRTAQPAGSVVAPANDIPNLLSGSITGAAFFWGVVVVLFAFLQFEFYRMLAFNAPLRPGILTLLWCGLAGFFLWRSLATGRIAPLAALGFCAVVAITKSFIDMDDWRLAYDFCFHADHSLALVFARWIDFASVLILLLIGGCLLYRPARSEGQFMARVFGYTGLVLLFIYLTLEVNTLLFWRLREFQGGGVTVLWTIYAFGLVAGGIWKKVAPLRYAGLTLFAIVVGKVFLVDLAAMPVIYRVVAFLVLGVLLLLGAFIYLYAGKQFRKES